MSGEILTSLHGRLVGLSKDGDLLVFNRNDNTIVGASRYTKITSAQLLAAFGTPITVVASPGAGLVIVVDEWEVRTDAGTAYTVPGTSDLVLKYTDASGAQAAGQVETTGFLDQATTQLRIGAPYIGAVAGTPSGLAPVANAPIVLQVTVANVTAGTSPLYVKVRYHTVSTTFSA